MFALGCNTTQTEPGVLATLPKFTLATPMHSELYIAKSTLLLALTVLSLMLFVLSCDCLSHLSLGFSWSIRILTGSDKKPIGNDANNTSLIVPWHDRVQIALRLIIF